MDLCLPWLEESSPLFERSTNGFCSLISAWNKKTATFIERKCFVFCSISLQKDIQVVIMKLQLLHVNNKMLIGDQKKHTNQDTYHLENSPTNRCGSMDTDDEAAGQLISTDVHFIIVAALEGHE